jgi:SAM-dependent methyltransferase
MAKAWFDEHLACPDCLSDLQWHEDGVTCVCGFSAAPGSPRDFRPRLPRPRKLDFQLRPNRQAVGDFDLSVPEITYYGPSAVRDSRELFSAAAPFLRRGGRFLDLGCGPRDQAVAAAHYGLDYVGIDIVSAASDILADGHALPFREATFDAVLAYAVLEHLYNPFVALSDIARVLKPGGVFFGTVSQGEPFHDSFFHHTSWGVLSVMGSAGLDVRWIWPSYDTLHALSKMGRYPRLLRVLIEMVHRIMKAAPILAPRAFFRSTAREKRLNALHRAASIGFVAVKAAVNAA